MSRFALHSGSCGGILRGFLLLAKGVDHRVFTWENEQVQADELGNFKEKFDAAESAMVLILVREMPS